MVASILTSGNDHHPSRCYNQCSLHSIPSIEHLCQCEVGSEEPVLHEAGATAKDEEHAKPHSRYSSHYATTMTTTMMSTAMATSSPSNKKEKRRCIFSSQSNAAAAPCRRLFQEEHYHTHSQQSNCRLNGSEGEVEQAGSSNPASEAMDRSLLLQSVYNDDEEHPMSDQLLGIAAEDEESVLMQDAAAAHLYAAEEDAVVLTTDDEQANFDQHMPRVHDDCSAATTTIDGGILMEHPSLNAMMEWSAATSITASVSSSRPITRPPSSAHMVIEEYRQHHQWHGHQERYYHLLTRSSSSSSSFSALMAFAGKTTAKTSTRQDTPSMLMPKQGRIAKCEAKMHRVDAAAAVANEEPDECLGGRQVFFFSQPAPSADPLPLLPCHPSPRDAIPRISPATMVDILDGCYVARFAVTVIDCRYPYEFDGGHIPGAINVASPSEIHAVLDANSPSEEHVPSPPHVLLFHCEFSSERAPRMALHVRRQDRLANAHRYPHLSHPHLYILDGGYRAFWQHSPDRCAPPYHYRPMRDALFKPELRLHQRASKATARQRKVADKSKRKCAKDSLIKADTIYSQPQECNSSYASSPAAFTALRRAAAHQHPFFPAPSKPRQSSLGSEI